MAGCVRDLQEHLELCGPGLSLTDVVMRLMRGGGTSVIQSSLVEFKFGRTSMSMDITTVGEEWCTLVFLILASSSAVLPFVIKPRSCMSSGIDGSRCSKNLVLAFLPVGFILRQALSPNSD